MWSSCFPVLFCHFTELNWIKYRIAITRTLFTNLMFTIVRKFISLLCHIIIHLYKYTVGPRSMLAIWNWTRLLGHIVRVLLIFFRSSWCRSYCTLEQYLLHMMQTFKMILLTSLTCWGMLAEILLKVFRIMSDLHYFISRSGS